MHVQVFYEEFGRLMMSQPVIGFSFTTYAPIALVPYVILLSLNMFNRLAAVFVRWGLLLTTSLCHLNALNVSLKASAISCGRTAYLQKGGCSSFCVSEKRLIEHHMSIMCLQCKTSSSAPLNIISMHVQHLGPAHAWVSWPMS